MNDEENKVILYTSVDGKAKVALMSREGRVWLNQKQMAELFGVSKPNISMLIAKIFNEKELDDSVVKCYLTTAAARCPNSFAVLSGPGKVSHEDAVEISAERYEDFDAVRKREEARLADEADLEELRRIEEEIRQTAGSRSSGSDKN